VWVGLQGMQLVWENIKAGITTFPGELEEYEAKRITRLIVCDVACMC
jgi:hypothetical protein